MLAGRRFLPSLFGNDACAFSNSFSSCSRTFLTLGLSCGILSLLEAGVVVVAQDDVTEREMFELMVASKLPPMVMIVDKSFRKKPCVTAGFSVTKSISIIVKALPDHLVFAEDMMK